MQRIIPNQHLTNTTISQLVAAVFMCSKCNKYNAVLAAHIQNCVFCGNPNYVKLK